MSSFLNNGYTLTLTLFIFNSLLEEEKKKTSIKIIFENKIFVLYEPDLPRQS